MNDLDDLLRSIGMSSTSTTDRRTSTPATPSSPAATLSACSTSPEPEAQKEEHKEADISDEETMEIFQTLEESLMEEEFAESPSEQEEMDEEREDGLRENERQEDWNITQTFVNAVSTPGDASDEGEVWDEDEQEESEDLTSWEETTSENTTNEGTSEQPQDNDFIPENFSTTTMNETTVRFSGAAWYEAIRSKKVLIAGLGGIGSWTSLLIGRMAIRGMLLYDPDVVGMENMSGQLYSRDDVGKTKVAALSNILYKYTSSESIFGIPDRFYPNTEPDDIMICGFDNMAARNTFFRKWKAHVFGKNESERKKCLFIDGRMNIEMFQVFCITGTDTGSMRRYEQEFLFGDSEAEDAICSLKQTSYLAAMIGSVITNLFTNFTANQLDPDFPYTLPFFTSYNAQSMTLTTEM